MKTTTIFAASVALTALLASCGGPKATAPTPVQAAVVTSIDGTVQNWTKGAATVGLYDDERVAVASAPLAASGKFNLTLPSATAVAPYLMSVGNAVTNENGCSGSTTSSDQQAQGLGISKLSVTDANGTSLTTIEPLTYSPRVNTPQQLVVDINGHTWLYVDRPTTLSGSLTCKDTSEGGSVSLTTSINAKVSAGWNILNVNGTGTFTATQTSGAVNIDIKVTGGTDGPTLWMDSSSMASAQSKSSMNLKLLPNFQDALNHLPLLRK